MIIIIYIYIIYKYNHPEVDKNMKMSKKTSSHFFGLKYHHFITSPSQ